MASRDGRVAQRRNVSESKDVGNKASREHNHTSSKGDLTLGCLSICLSLTFRRLQDDEGALVRVRTPSLVLS